jgi:hypothetical protein
MTQTVDVSADAGPIDGGAATFDLSGWLGGYSSQKDRAGVTATFLGTTGASLGTAQLGPVTARDRDGTSQFLQRTALGAIPPGTRSIKVDVTFTLTSGTITDGYADDLSLSVTPSIAAAPLTPPASTAPRFDHVFLIFMENENYSRKSNRKDRGAGIVGNRHAPYLNSLLPLGTSLARSFAITHNSDPNYIAVAAGQTFGHSSGSGAPPANCIATCTFNATSLIDELDGAGEPWKQYVQSQKGDCDTKSHGNYEPDDVPFYYFARMKNDSNYCQAHWQPLTQLFSDLQSTATTPSFVWADADGCDDMEDCGIEAGDTWLSETVPAIMASPAWTQQRSLLVITWDEDGGDAPGGFGKGQTNQIPTFLLGSRGLVKAGYSSSVRYDHYSTGRTIEAALGLAAMTANDRYATPINDAFTERARSHDGGATSCRRGGDCCGLARLAACGAAEKQGALASVVGELGGAAEFGGGLMVATEAREQVAADTGQEVVLAHGWC